MTKNSEAVDGILIIPDGVTELPDALFAGRCDIERVVMPDSLRVLGMELFTGCSALKSVRLPGTLRDLSPAIFAECPLLSDITLPETLVSVGDGAFLSCPSLHSIKLPNSLREICDLAFWGTGLESISVPEGVARIGEHAFWSCEELRKADVLGRDTVICENAFGSCYKLVEGYIAPGYPMIGDPPSELLYTLLWCTCPDRHTAEVTARAEDYIRHNEALIIERIFKSDNVPALSGIAERKLLSPGNIEKYVRLSAESGKTELTALLLKAQGTARNTSEDFNL